MNKEFLKILFKQLFEAEAYVIELSVPAIRTNDPNEQLYNDRLKRAKAAEAQCVANIDNYLIYHSKP